MNKMNTKDLCMEFVCAECENEYNVTAETVRQKEIIVSSDENMDNGGKFTLTYGFCPICGYVNTYQIDNDKTINLKNRISKMLLLQSQGKHVHKGLERYDKYNSEMKYTRVGLLDSLENKEFSFMDKPDESFKIKIPEMTKETGWEL